MKLEFSRHIFRKYLNFMKIHSVGAELFYADAQTDMHYKANVVFHNFVNVPISKLLIDFLHFNLC